jgi:hypothetical protein
MPQPPTQRLKNRRTTEFVQNARLREDNKALTLPTLGRGKSERMCLFRERIAALCHFWFYRGGF